MVKPFEEQPGIISVTSGYTGGHVPNPTYEQVTTGTTGHTEAVEIEYDPEVISYDQLVEIYWQQTDPTDALGQFADRGDSYRPVIYYNDEEERNIAERSKQALQDSGRFDKPIVTKNRTKKRILSCRRLPSGLLQEKQAPLQSLSRRFWTCRFPSSTLGRQEIRSRKATYGTPYIRGCKTSILS